MRITSSIVTCLFLLSSQEAFADVAISLSPLIQRAVPGETVNIAVGFSGLAEDKALSAYDLALSYDPYQLRFEGLTFGDPLLGDQLFWNEPALNQVTLPEFGLVELIAFSTADAETLRARQAKRFDLASLQFTALSMGSSQLRLNLYSLSDQNGELLSATSQSATVSIAGVPLPASFWLFGTSLLPFCVRRKTV